MCIYDCIKMCHQCTMELSSSVGSCREWRDAGSNGFLQKQFVAQQMAQIQKSPSPLLTLQSSKTSQLGFYWHFRRCIPLITLAGRAEPVGTEQLKGRSVWKHVRPLILIGTDGLLSCWGKKKKKKTKGLRALLKTKSAEESIPRFQLSRDVPFSEKLRQQCSF